jgi:hypothetical protein
MEICNDILEKHATNVIISLESYQAYEKQAEQCISSIMTKVPLKALMIEVLFNEQNDYSYILMTMKVLYGYAKPTPLNLITPVTVSTPSISLKLANYAKYDV